MARNVPKSIDYYGIFLTESMASWSSEQHVAWAAAVAQRWLPSYESFSYNEDWGDPASLRRSLEAVWSHVAGRMLSPSHAAQHIQQIDDVTPYMDDFDAEDALIACALLKDALRACGEPDNSLRMVSQMAMAMLEFLLEQQEDEDTPPSRAWKSASVRSEVRAEMKLVDEIGRVTEFDAQAVDALRARLGELVGDRPARSKPSVSPGLTNQAAFEQYRRIVEHDLKSNKTDMSMAGANVIVFAMLHAGAWGRRYGRRAKAIDGESRASELADQAGRRALIALNRAVNQVESGPPDWDSDIRDTIELCMTNTGTGGSDDARAVSEPHAYGPSLRRLWLEAKRQRRTDQEAWDDVVAWANHRPTAWDAEDQRKKRGWAHAVPELGVMLAKELSWEPTKDPMHPWTIEVNGARWSVRINDFPDELFYGLIVDGAHVGDFHDWPETWRRCDN